MEARYFMLVIWLVCIGTTAFALDSSASRDTVGVWRLMEENTIYHNDYPWSESSWGTEYYYDPIYATEIDSTLSHGMGYGLCLYEYEYFPAYYEINQYRPGGGYYSRTLQRFTNGDVILYKADYNANQTTPARYYEYTYTPSGLLESFHYHDYGTLNKSQFWYYDTTGKPDSLLEYSLSGYFKTFFSYNNQNNCTQQVKYFSADTLSWQLFTITNSSFVFTWGEWKPIIDSISFYVNGLPDPNHYASVTHSYLDQNRHISNNYLETQIYSGFHDYTTTTTDTLYNSAGMLIEKSYMFMHENIRYTKDTYYTWDYYVPNEDPYIPPPIGMKLSVYPSPFRDKCEFTFKQASPGRVTLEIYNLKGQKVRCLLDETKASGNILSTWDGTDEQGRMLASGVYLARAKTAGAAASTKVILLK